LPSHHCLLQYSRLAISIPSSSHCHPLPSYCRPIAIPLPYRSLLPCCWLAIATLLPPHCHPIATSLPSYCHPIAIPIAICCHLLTCCRLVIAIAILVA
jgi:hypothetical protein